MPSKSTNTRPVRRLGHSQSNEPIGVIRGIVTLRAYDNVTSHGAPMAESQLAAQAAAMVICLRCCP